MRLRYLDTSIILESLFEHAPCHLQALEIMEAIDQGREHVLLSPLNIAEVFHIMIKREKISFPEVERFIQKIFQTPAMHIASISKDILESATPIACKYTIDLTDAVNYQLMKNYHITQIYALDVHFNVFKSIQCLTALKL